MSVAKIFSPRDSQVDLSREAAPQVLTFPGAIRNDGFTSTPAGRFAYVPDHWGRLGERMRSGEGGGFCITLDLEPIDLLTNLPREGETYSGVVGIMDSGG